MLQPVYLKMWVLSEAGRVCCKQHPPSSMCPAACAVCPEGAAAASEVAAAAPEVANAPGGRPLLRAKSGGVERPAHALSRAKCRCLSEPAWQSSPSRHRLISPDTVRRQLSRFSSHHSSSDEDWFEVVEHETHTEDVFLPADTKPVDGGTSGRIKRRASKCCVLL